MRRSYWSTAPPSRGDMRWPLRSASTGKSRGRRRKIIASPGGSAPHLCGRKPPAPRVLAGMAVRRPARRVGSHPGCVAGHVDGIPGRCRPLRNKPRSAARRGPYRWTACPVADGDRRFGHRLYQETLSAWTTTPQSRTLVIRAGRAGQRLARELLFTPALGYRPVCFVDDDPEKRGQRVHGLMVTGTRNDLQRLVRQFRIDVLVFASPSPNPEGRPSILAGSGGTPDRT